MAISPTKEYAEPIPGFPICSKCRTHLDYFSILVGSRLCTLCRAPRIAKVKGRPNKLRDRLDLGSPDNFVEEDVASDIGKIDAFDYEVE